MVLIGATGSRQRVPGRNSAHDRMSPPSDEPDRSGVIAVDLDGTLLRTDVMFESIAALLRKPWALVPVAVHLFRGRAAMKAELARRVHLDLATLPANTALVDWLVGERGRGRTLALFSAANDTVVRRLADRFGIFDHAEGSGERVNLSGTCKCEAIERRYGADFSYAGDCRRDIPIWRRCGRAILVGDVERLRRRLPPSTRIERTFPAAGAGLSLWARALRLHQGIKNALIFVPLLLSGHIDEPRTVATLLAFAAFGLIASANYLVNDLMDLSADRAHPSKSRRPFASGALSIRAGLLALPLLAAAAIATLTLLPVRLASVAGVYVVVTLLYSARLKREPVLDLVVLAFLYTLRLVAGMVVIGAPLSPWLLAFSMFFFFSVASVKRFAEVRTMNVSGRAETAGRDYRASDEVLLLGFGLASGFSSTLVFFIYLVDPASPARNFERPEFLSIICVILAYWLGRVWLIANRGGMHVDPVLFALRDRVSLALGALMVLLVVSARW